MFNHRRFQFKLNDKRFKFVFRKDFNEIVDYLKISENIIEIKNIVSNFFANSIMLNFHMLYSDMKLKIFNQDDNVLIIAMNDYRSRIVFNKK